MPVSRRVLMVSTFVRRNPLLFNSLVYGSLYTGAEFMQQTYNNKLHLVLPEPKHVPAVATIEEVIRPPTLVQKFLKILALDQDAATIPGDYNWAQLKRYAIYGCFLAGPILHGWYHWLDNVFRGYTKKIVLQKLIVDQFILTPPLVALFFVSMSLMEGEKDIFMECRVKFIQTFQTSCMYWIPVQFVNFLTVPPALRVLFVSVAAFCWANILCYLKRQSPQEISQNKLPSI